MENWTLIKNDDRSFVNPFLLSKQPNLLFPTTEDFIVRVQTFALKVLKQWEREVKEEINTTGWKDLSVYTGKSGYALLYLDSYLTLDSTEYLEQAFFMAEKCVMNMHLHSDTRDLTFLTGGGGPLAVSAVCAHLLKQPEKQHHFIHKLQHLYRSSEALINPNGKFPDELLYGRAGCLYSLLFVKKFCKGKVDDDLIQSIANAMIDSGRQLSKKCLEDGYTKTPPLMFEWHGKKYLGPAHGIAGIIYLLLQIKDYLDPKVLEEEIRPCLDFLLETRFPSGNFPSSLEADRDRLVQWCHGAPGFIHCFVSASKVFHSDLYLAAAKRCAEVTWERGILTKGFSICHGISGNAFAILHLYQHTKDPLYMHRACKMAEIIMDDRPHEFRTPDRPLSMFEGTAGVICFLLNLLNPEKSIFPGYQVDSFEKTS